MADSANISLKPYRGRFAPSPTGALHQGSLVAALASYLDAKAHRGTWLVRMEDLDPPRAQRGAADAILEALAAHHLFSDEPVLYQSSRLAAYTDALNALAKQSYPCTCTRQRIRSLGGVYDGYCRQQTISDTLPAAIRLSIDPQKAKDLAVVNDLFLGVTPSILSACGDIIIRRKDGLFAYQLAVAVDDHYQGITHVVRGADLFGSTNRQRYILQCLAYDEPHYGHTPLVMLDAQNKLSKQTGATAVNNQDAFDNLSRALAFLNHTPPDVIKAADGIDALLAWGIEHWQRENVPSAAPHTLAM